MILIDRWPLPGCSFTSFTLLMQAISIFSGSLSHTTKQHKQAIIAVSTWPVDIYLGSTASGQHCRVWVCCCLIAESPAVPIVWRRGHGNFSAPSGGSTPSVRRQTSKTQRAGFVLEYTVFINWQIRFWDGTTEYLDLAGFGGNLSAKCLQNSHFLCPMRGLRREVSEVTRHDLTRSLPAIRSFF